MTLTNCLLHIESILTFAFRMRLGLWSEYVVEWASHLVDKSISSSKSALEEYDIDTYVA